MVPERHATVGLQSTETALLHGAFSNGHSNLFFFLIQISKKVECEDMLCLSTFLKHDFSVYILVCQMF